MTKLLQFRPNKDTSALIAYLTVALFWGSTYLVIRIGVQHMPPAAMAAMRFLIAGFLMLLIVRLTGRPLPSRAVDWRTNIVVGVLLLGVANGLVVWAEQFIESGIASIIVVTATLWMVLFSAILPGKKLRPTPSQLIGLLIGFAGTFVLVGANLDELRTTDWRGPAALTVAAASWGLGTVYSQRRPTSSGPFVNSALQMIFGGTALAVVATVRGEWGGLEPTWQGAAVIAYLVIFGSIVSFTAYVHLLRLWPANVAGTYTYLNVVVAVFLGWLILDEPLTARTLIAAVTVLAAVAWVRAGGRRHERARTDDSSIESRSTEPPLIRSRVA